MRAEKIEHLNAISKLSKAEQWFYHTYGKFGSRREIEQAVKNKKKDFVWKEYNDEVIREPAKFRNFKISKKI
jgi:hypothetical protein